LSILTAFWQRRLAQIRDSHHCFAPLVSPTKLHPTLPENASRSYDQLLCLALYASGSKPGCYDNYRVPQGGAWGATSYHVSIDIRPPILTPKGDFKYKGAARHKSFEKHCSMPYAKRSRLNLVVQKQRIKCW